MAIRLAAAIHGKAHHQQIEMAALIGEEFMGEVGTHRHKSKKCHGILGLTLKKDGSFSPIFAACKK